MPVDSESPVQRYLGEHGEGFFRIALEVDDIEGQTAELESRGVKFTERVRVAFNNWRVAFINPTFTYGVHAQLLEPARLGKTSEGVWGGTEESPHVTSQDSIVQISSGERSCAQSDKKTVAFYSKGW